MTREEAIEVVKERLDYYGREKRLKAACETLIPELTESEDERIRTALCDIVRDMPYMETELRAHGLTVEKTIAYLEKQKEQKPAECLKAERDGWYVCIKDFYAGGKKQCSVGDLVQAKGGMYMMGKEDISEWFRRAYYEEVRDAFAQILIRI